MSYLLSELIQGALARAGGEFFEHVTLTGGSTATFIDTNKDDAEDDMYNGGFIVVEKTTDGLAPQGEFTKITDYDSATMTGTLSPVLSAALGSGDIVKLVNPDLKLETVKMLANYALADAGMIALRDESLTTVDDQTEYAMPAGASLYDPIKVEIQSDLITSGDEDWKATTAFEIEPGAAPKLRLRFVPEGGYKIAIEYYGYHPAVALYNDAINENVPKTLVELVLATELFHFKGVNNDNQNAANFVLAQLDDAKKSFRPRKQAHSNRILSWR